MTAKEFLRQNLITCSLVLYSPESITSKVKNSNLPVLVTSSLELMSSPMKVIFDNMFNQPGIVYVQNLYYYLQQVSVLTQRREFMFASGVRATNDLLTSLFSFMQTSPKSLTNILTSKIVKTLGTIIRNISFDTEMAPKLTKTFLQLILSRSAIRNISTNELWQGNSTTDSNNLFALLYGSVVSSDALDKFVLRSQRTNAELVRFSSENLKSLDLLLKKKSSSVKW